MASPTERSSPLREVSTQQVHTTGETSSAFLSGAAPMLTKPSEIPKRIEESKEIDWKKIATRALSLISGIALGVLTGLAVTGIMVTPVGWGIAGGALLIAMVGSIACGGPKEFLKSLLYASAGFTMGFGAGGLAGLHVAAGAANVAIMGLDKASRTLAYLSCMALVGGSIATPVVIMRDVFTENAF